MHILVTNDDGVHAPGILALVQAMRTLGKVSVLAPERNWSGAGHTKTLDSPLLSSKTTLEDGSPAHAISGAPSDCVALALLGFFDEEIDLVVSGINPTPNLGHDITYSGTVMNAMEAVIKGVPGFAFSLDGFNAPRGSTLDFQPAANVARKVIKVALEKPLPEDVFLNVNIPYLPEDEMKGTCITRQGERLYHDVLDRRADPRGKPYYWYGGGAPTGVPDADTDIGALAAGYVSLTPLQLDLTAHHALDTMKDWMNDGEAEG
jgi:5'-nucleotidase